MSNPLPPKAESYRLQVRRFLGRHGQTLPEGDFETELTRFLYDETTEIVLAASKVARDNIELREKLLKLDGELGIRAAQLKQAHAAIVRLLFRSVADGDTCVCEPYDGDLGEVEDVADICEAFRALGYGEHWDAKVFDEKAPYKDVKKH